MCVSRGRASRGGGSLTRASGARNCQTTLLLYVPIRMHSVIPLVLAWAGALGGAGITSGLRPVPLFAALLLTGLTIAAAAIPRYTYRYLQARNWDRADPASIAREVQIIGAHMILVVVQIVLVASSNDMPSSSILAGVSMLGTVLWGVHEALAARKIYEMSRS